jgi:hypothetical protein
MLGITIHVGHSCTIEKLEKGVGIELGRIRLVHREETKGGLGCVGKNPTHAQKGDERGRRIWVGDGKYIRKHRGKETKGEGVGGF